MAFENVPPLKTQLSIVNSRLGAAGRVTRFITADRSRLLAVVMRCEGPDLIGTALIMPHCAKKGLQDDGVWCNPPRDLMQAQTKAIYLCREYLPAEV